MRIFSAVASLLSFASLAVSQYEVTRYCEAQTGICFSSFTFNGISYRVALPQNANQSDAIIQIVAPNSLGWAAFAWGGSMRFNPLTVTWKNGNNVVVSSRRATSWSFPQPFTGVTYTPLKGTGVNNTHWKFTARCQGCTTWLNQNNQPTTIQNSASTQFAFAYSNTPPMQPSSNTSSFQHHNNYGFWQHSLEMARSPSYDSWWQNNLL